MDLFEEKKAPQALSVTQLVRRMKNLLEIEIGEVWVEGEVSNLRRQASGHWYFSLKDDRAQISCAMFSAARRRGSADIEDGVRVRVFAEPGIYEARGQLQIIVSRAERAGVGELQARFEALKRKLDALGWFAAERKKPLPGFPRIVGLVTSGTGAALKDIMNVMSRRAPWVQPVLVPVRVQGRGAEHEIARAIRRLGHPEESGLPDCDVLIVGRGGGSIEDLWNFNEEVVAAAIHECPIPVVSAVGHEIDFTIADFVADLRAPTPSAAAELVVPDGGELLERLRRLDGRMRRSLSGRTSRLEMWLGQVRRSYFEGRGERLLREPSMRLDAQRERLDGVVEDRWIAASGRLRELRRALQAHHPERWLRRANDSVGQMEARLRRAMAARWERKAADLRRLRSLLEALGPSSAFERGFAIVMDAEGRVLRSVEDVREGDELVTRLKDGRVCSRVERAVSE